MVVLRKEIKMGIGAGLAILGIAGVYGLMASLSGSHDQTAQVSTDSSNDPLHGAVPGLPPTDDKPDATPVKPPESTKIVDAAPKADPFSESLRSDGNKGDAWASALSTGRIEDIKNGSSKSADPLVDRAPVARKDSPKLVDPTAMVDEPKSTQKGGTKTETKTEFAGGTTYKVQAGDTFSTISEKVYGNKKFFNVLVKANPQVNPSRMKIGQEIAVPPKDAVASVGGAIETSVTKLAKPIDATRQYRIAPGDTLSKIASKLYGRQAMWQAIYEANKAAIGPNEAKLKVGMVLNLPEKPVR